MTAASTSSRTGNCYSPIPDCPLFCILDLSVHSDPSAVYCLGIDFLSGSTARWWREAQDPQPGSGLRGVPYAACQTPTSYGMKIINNLFSSDLVFNLRRDGDLREDEDDGSRGRCYALIGSDLWAQSLNRYRHC